MNILQLYVKKKSWPASQSFDEAHEFFFFINFVQTIVVYDSLARATDYIHSRESNLFF